MASFLKDLRARGLIPEVEVVPNGLYLRFNPDVLSLMALDRLPPEGGRAPPALSARWWKKYTVQRRTCKRIYPRLPR